MGRVPACVFALGAATAVAAQSAAAAPLVPRSLEPLRSEPVALLQVRAGAGAVERTLRDAGARRVSHRMRVWRLSSGAARRLVPRLALSGALREFEPDHVRRPTGHIAAGDPLLPFQWWLPRVGATAAEPPGPGKPVTAIDSGLDLSHPEFARRPDTRTLNEQSVTGRQEFHGTAVASLIGAPANGVGIVGVYPSARLAMWDASPRGVLRASEIIAGIEAGTQLGPGVVTLSLGGSFSELEAEAVAHAVERGSLVVAAAGNEGASGSPASFPANLPHVLTVGATDEADAVSEFSNRGRALDVVAPGEDIVAAVPTSFGTDGYARLEGTSFSAPIVAGAAAWVWTVRPDLDNTQVFELIRRSARDLGEPGRDPATGFGLLDIPAALRRAAPARDPYEPNESVEMVRPSALFAAGQPALTLPRRGRATLQAALDVVDDPRDVYRVWVPARSRVTVVVQPSTRAVDLQLLVRPPGATARRTATPAPRETLTVTNGSRTGGFAFVSALLRAAASPGEATYRLSVSTSARR